MHVLVRDGQWCLARVRNVAGEEFVEQDASAVHIAARVCVTPVHLFGGEVRDGPDEHTLGGSAHG